jgi:hypothetical protein
MEDFTKPDKICDGYSSAWPLWVIPKGVSADGTQDEIGIQGQIKKPKDLLRLVKEVGPLSLSPLSLSPLSLSPIHRIYPFPLSAVCMVSSRFALLRPPFYK